MEAQSTLFYFITRCAFTGKICSVISCTVCFFLDPFLQRVNRVVFELAVLIMTLRVQLTLTSTSTTRQVSVPLQNAISDAHATVLS